MTNELSPEQLAAVEKIQKLLNLAAKNPNEAEAASAASKAQELLARYNLDAATVENKSGVDGHCPHRRNSTAWCARWKAVSDMAIHEWSDVQPYMQNKVRRRIAEICGKNDLTHEAVEQALTEIVPDLKLATVEDDEFHLLVTVVYAEYIQSGGIDQ